MEPAPPPDGQPPARPADALGGLRHRWWIVVIGVLLGAGAGAGWLQLAAPVYEATTSVLVHPVGRDTNVVGGRTQGQVNLDTEAQLVRSTAVATGAAEALGSADPDPLARRVRVEVPPNTSVLAITFAAGTPARAQQGANAFATAYLAHREGTARAELAAEVSAIEARLADLTGSLGQVNEQLATVPSGSAAAADLEGQRATITDRLGDLTARRDELATATISPGAVISEARLPTTPAAPIPAIVIASGVGVGLVGGILVGLLAELLNRRVRRGADLPRRLGVPVLTELGRRAAPRTGELASPHLPGGRAFDRLRNEVVAQHPVRVHPDGRTHPDGRLIVVSSPTPGVGSTVTAANLAAALSRGGYEVVLVSVHGEAGDGLLSHLLGARSAPGLVEVLAGRVSVTDAIASSPHHPRLRMLTMGAPTSEPLPSPALPHAFAPLLKRAAYVIVDAPPTSVSADAQSLATHADGALLVVERGHTRLAEVADAMDQLQRVGTGLLGAVVLPRIGGRRWRRGTTPDRPPHAGEPLASDPLADSGIRVTVPRPGDPATIPDRGTPARPRSNGRRGEERQHPSDEPAGGQPEQRRSGQRPPLRPYPLAPHLRGGPEADTVILPRAVDADQTSDAGAEPDQQSPFRDAGGIESPGGSAGTR